MRDQRGQALLIAVLLLLLAGLAIRSVLAISQGVTNVAEQRHAAEAAAYAAGTVVADAHYLFMLGRTTPPSPEEEARFVESDELRETATGRAREVAWENHGARLEEIRIEDNGPEFLVRARYGGGTALVSVEKTPCCPR